MESSASIKELAEALAKAQAVLANASRDKDNTYYKNKYADLESVVGVIRPAIKEFGLSYVQSCHDWDVGVKVETIILHNSGEWLSCGILSIPAVKADAAGFMSALTYARRGSLSTAFGVATEDDDGQGTIKKGKESGKSEARSEWDKLDEETQKGMTHEAMAVTVMLNAGDIQGAFDHIATLEYDDSFRTAFESRLDSQQRAMIKNYSHIIHAQTLDSLTAAFKAAPKYAQPLLQPYATKRKQELQPMEAAA